MDVVPWSAARGQAEVLEGEGRVEEAVVLVEPYARAGGVPLAYFGRLLVRCGRRDEAIDRLKAGIEDVVLATALVEVAEGAGRDEEIAAMLARRIPAEHRCESPWCCHGLNPDEAIALLATIRERQGRVDEAIALLRTRYWPYGELLADLLIRQDRIQELREYAESDQHGDATRRLAEVLEERGDLEGAVALYRQPGRPWDGSADLAQLLARHGRYDEAIEVLRHSPGSDEDWVVDMLRDLEARQ